MRRLDWTRPALSDLRAIDAWLSREAAPDIAVRTLTKIRERADFLLDFPAGGPPLSGGDVHSLRVGGLPYVLLYRLEGDNGIQILRERHARQNWREE
jgi:plasmid stabilization system protein ParE